MGFLFSKPKSAGGKADISSKDKAVYDLKVQRDRLNKYIAQAEALTQKETDLARQLLKAGQTAKAKLCIKKKKVQQKLIEATRAKLFNVEELINSIDYAEMQSQVFQALKEGNDALQKINSQLSLDDVEKLMDDASEAIAYQEELDSVLSKELSPADDDDVLAELDQLEEEEAKEIGAKLPDVPISVPADPIEEPVEAPVVKSRPKEAVLA